MARIEYVNKEGKSIPGVTTIIDHNLGWSKNALMAWGWKMGKAGLNLNDVSKKATDIGSCAHLMISAHLKDQDVHEAVKDWPKETQEKAETCFLMYLEWEEQHKVMPMLVEQSLVSEIYQYGGTPDLVAWVDDKVSVVDFKSSNDIYPEYRIQVAAYEQLCKENTFKVNAKHLLRIGKDKPEFEHVYMLDLSLEFEAFKLLRKLHELKEKIK